MKLVWNEPQKFAQWAAEELAKHQVTTTGKFWPPYTAIGTTDDNGNPTACGILNCYNIHDIELTIVGKGHFTRTLWRAIAGYVWFQLDCKRMTFRMRADNYPAIKLAFHFGAQPEGRLRKYYGDCDAIVFGLLKEECLYVKSFQSA